MTEVIMLLWEWLEEQYTLECRNTNQCLFRVKEKVYIVYTKDNIELVYLFNQETRHVWLK